MILYEAIEAGDLGVVRSLLRIDPSIVASPFDSGDYPLHIAAMAGNFELVVMLLEFGCAVNVKGSEGKSALHFAVEGAHKDVVECLIEAGADLNATDDHGMSIMAYSARSFANPVGEDLDEGKLFHFLLLKGAKYDLLSAGYKTDFKRIKEIVAGDHDSVSQLVEPNWLFGGVLFGDWGTEDDKIDVLRFLFANGLNIPPAGIHEAIQSCEMLKNRSKIALHLRSCLSR